MKLFIIFLLSLFAYSVKAQISFATPVGNDYKSLTMIINKVHVDKSIFYYNDLKSDPVMLISKKDTTVLNTQLSLLSDTKGVDYFFVTVPKDLSQISVYDTKFKFVANLINDSYMYRTQVLTTNKKQTQAPLISSEQLVKLFMLLL